MWLSVSKYKIYFGKEAYTGKCYLHQGKYYAILDSKTPKLYNSKEIAESAAKVCVHLFANISNKYEIIEVTED